jgi:hypothetical protein
VGRLEEPVNLPPSKLRLLKMRDSGVTTKQTNLAKLIQDRCSGCCDVIVAHRHTQYGGIARAGFAQHWRILASELRQWYAMDTRDFFWICRR